mgnify:CR=1 FL=1
MKHKGGRPVELPEKIEITRLFLKNGYSVKEIAKMAYRGRFHAKHLFRLLLSYILLYSAFPGSVLNKPASKTTLRL